MEASQDGDATVDTSATVEQVSQNLFTETHTSNAPSSGILPTLDPPTHQSVSGVQTIDLTSLDGESMHSDMTGLDGDPFDDLPRANQPPQCTPSPTMQLLSEQIKSYRIFLDICAGASRPLSKAMLPMSYHLISC